MMYTEADIKEDFLRCFNTLNMFEKCIYEMRINGKTYREIGEKYNLSRSRIQYIYVRIKEKLKLLYDPPPPMGDDPDPTEEHDTYIYDHSAFVSSLDKYRTKIRIRELDKKTQIRIRQIDKKRQFLISHYRLCRKDAFYNKWHMSWPWDRRIDMLKAGDFQDWIRVEVSRGEDFHALKVHLRKEYSLIIKGSV